MRGKQDGPVFKETILVLSMLLGPLLGFFFVLLLLRGFGSVPGGSKFILTAGFLGWLALLWKFANRRNLVIVLGSALGTIACLFLVVETVQTVLFPDQKTVNINQSNAFLDGCASNEIRLIYFDAESGRRMMNVDLKSGEIREDMTGYLHTVGPGFPNLNSKQLNQLKDMTATLPSPRWTLKGFLIGYEFDDECHIAFCGDGTRHIFHYPKNRIEPKPAQLFAMIKTQMAGR